MEPFNFIYLLIPFLAYSIQTVIVTKYSRMHGSLSMTFYRQLTICLIGLPLFYFFPLDFNILKENIGTVLLTSAIGGTYLFLLFKSYDYIPVAIGSAFALTSRILLTVVVGILLLSESINLYQGVGIITLLIAVFSLLRFKEKFSYKGVILSILCGSILVANWYFFIQYSTNFHPVIAGYILEFFNGIFLLLGLFGKSFFQKESIKSTFKIDRKTFSILFISAPLVLIGTSAISKSYELFSFTMVGIALTMMLPASLIFSWLILKEKLSLKSIISIIIITLSIIAIKFFEG